MIPIQSTDRIVTQNSNVGRSMNYRLDSRNLRHIVTMLRDSVYSNKLLAILREYSTNALDAHVAATEAGRTGIDTTPIEVHLPTKFSPELRIRDFGPGLSTKEIEEIYISLGESTKRTSNKYVGSLGFGCKSAFAYGDRFVVTSWNGGTKTIYNNVLDDNVPEGARCDIMASAPCGLDETGIEITIPIRQNEIDECKQVALNFFKYWRILPVMTGVTEEEIAESLSYKKNESIFKGDNWIIYPRSYSYGSNSKGIALMGEVPYSIDWETVKRKLKSADLLNNNESVLFDFIQSNNTILTFNIGDLEFSVSRETLQYTDYTCQAILDRVNAMFTNIQEIIQKTIAHAANLWEAKRLYGIIFSGAYSVDPEEKSQFGGELHRIESFFKNRLVWNGIKIEGSTFGGLNMWEVGKGKKEDNSNSNYSYDSNDFESILTTFSLDRDKIRKGTTRRRRRYNRTHENGNIIPTKASMVLINDLDKPHGFLTTVRYLLQSDPKTEIKRVYALKFGSPTVRKQFYKEYNFDTVPVQYASHLLNNAKNWYSTVRPTKSSSIGPTGPLQVRTLRKDSKNGFSGRHHWYKEDVKLRDLNAVDYFVPIEKDNVITNKNSTVTTYYFMEYVSQLDKTTDWFKPIPIIYGILPRTVKSKWFSAAVKSGRFVNLFDHIRSEAKKIDINKLAESRHYYRYISHSHSLSHSDNFVATRKFADVMKNHLKFDGDMFKLCQALVGSYDDLTSLDGTLNQLDIKLDTDAIKITTNYMELLKNSNKKYPLVNRIGLITFRHSTQFDTNLIKEFAQYINMIDEKEGCQALI